MARPRQFPLDPEECKAKIEQYKEKCYSGEIEIPSITHFLAEIGSYPEEFFGVINNPNGKNEEMAIELKKLGNWCDARTIENADKLKALAAVMLAQGFSGYPYKSKPAPGEEKSAELTVKFGGSLADPFG